MNRARRPRRVFQGRSSKNSNKSIVKQFSFRIFETIVFFFFLMAGRYTIHIYTSENSRIFDRDDLELMIFEQ